MIIKLKWFSDLLNALVYDYLITCDVRLYDAPRKLDDGNDGEITTKELRRNHLMGKLIEEPFDVCYSLCELPYNYSTWMDAGFI